MFVKIKKKLIVIISVAISAVILFSGFGIFLMNEYHLEREKCFYLSESEMEDIITTVDVVMARTYTLRAMVKDHEGNTDFFDRVAPDLYDSVKEETGVSLKNIALAPGGIVEKVYPEVGNESLIGFDFMDPERPGNKEAIVAYQNGETILTNPFDLVQGGKGIAGRAPVIIEKDGKEELWGLITVTIDYDNLIEILNPGTLKSVGYSYELSFIDDEGNVNPMVFDGNMRGNPVVSEFGVRNLTWQISLEPTGGWIPTTQIIIGILAILAIIVLLGFSINSFLNIRESNEKLRFLSYRDGLTGTYSRHYVNTVLVNMQDGEWNNKELKYSLYIIDIDDFKHFNDNFGHDVGDRVIYMVAQVLKACIKEHCGDCAIRFGGDEFIVLLNDVTRDRFRDIGSMIMDGIHDIAFPDIPDLKVTISVGAAFYEDTDKPVYKELMQLADERLYIAKERGKNQIAYDDNKE